MNFRFSKSMILACAAMVSMAATSTFAQDKPAPKAMTESDASRLDIFVGYSYLAPHGTVEVIQPSTLAIEPVNYKSVNLGEIFSAAYYFNRYVGAQFELSSHEYGKDLAGQDNDGFITPSVGLIFRYPTHDITPFAHALAGASDVDGPEHESRQWGPALTIGGGLDYNTPLWDHKLAIRIFQADYQYIHADFGPVVYGGRANINAARLSAGIVLHIGSIAPPPPVTLACSASPASVFPGDPVTITATADLLNPKLKAVYTWSGTGVTGTGTTATVATGALAPGSYTVKGTVTEGDKPKPWLTADCSASFTVKAFEPPTVSCSANPSTIKPGDTSAVTATGVSPQNRPLTYTYSASAGSVSGTGTSATFSSAGAPTGTATITCTTTDDKGQTASATTPVTIEAPYVAPPAPTQTALCSITFDKDKKRPTRVDNEAKACLDDIALTLQGKSDATLAVVGSSTADEKTPPKHLKKGATPEDFAALRAVNTKDYLVTEKGIDATRITVYTGTGDGQKVEDYLVPSGATFTVSGATAVPADVKPQPRKAVAAKHPKKKAM